MGYINAHGTATQANDAVEAAALEAVFGPRRLAAESWKTSSLRDVVIRQVRSGRRLMNGGYRRLLAPHWAERRSGLRVAVGVGFVG